MLAAAGLRVLFKRFDDLREQQVAPALCSATARQLGMDILSELARLFTKLGHFFCNIQLISLRGCGVAQACIAGARLIANLHYHPLAALEVPLALPEGESVIKCPSPPNVLKGVYHHSCY